MQTIKVPLTNLIWCLWVENLLKWRLKNKNFHIMKIPFLEIAEFNALYMCVSILPTGNIINALWIFERLLSAIENVYIISWEPEGQYQ